MTPREKKTSHQWLEARFGNTWVLIDPTNGHFLENPHHYLVLYRGDQSLFTHSSVNYKIIVSKRMVRAKEVSEEKLFMGYTHVFKNWGFRLRC